jgi:PII-like signaling protein
MFFHNDNFHVIDIFNVQINLPMILIMLELKHKIRNEWII